MFKKSFGALLEIAIVVTIGITLIHKVATVFGRRGYNDDVDEALNSRVSNYKGQVVIRLPWSKRSGMSSGPIMFLGKGVKTDDRGRRLVRHEHGHYLEYQQLGYLKYLVGIGIPSVVNYFRKTRPYFNQPWEINADMLVGIERPDEHTTAGVELGKRYYEYLNANSLFSIIGNMGKFINHDLSVIKEDNV